MRAISAVSLALFCLLLSACSEKRAPEPVVVHLFRDRAAAEVESALLTLGKKHLKTQDGRPIVIATLEFKNYADGLEVLGRQDHPDLVIFNSLEDGKGAKIDVPPGSVVETPAKRFYLFIPSWVPSEKRETAEVVLAEFRRELQRTAVAVSGAPH